MLKAGGEGCQSGMALVLSLVLVLGEIEVCAPFTNLVTVEGIVMEGERKRGIEKFQIITP